jgi:GNAT superfamily N-acetyltransferase
LTLLAAPPPRFVLAQAQPAQTAAVLALLPELLQAPALPTRFWIVHPDSEPSQLLGAAAYAPVLHPAHSPGFRGHCRVLAPYRRQGMGRALVTRLAAEVTAWDVPHLLAWQAELEDGPASAFMRALGFRVNFSIHHFIADYEKILPLCQRMTQSLREHERVPPGFRLLPLAAVPRAAVVALHCKEFHASPAAADAAIEAVLADPLGQRLSLALWDGEYVAGYLLAGPGADMPDLRFWASDPAYRYGWPAVLLLDGYMRMIADCGLRQSRFICNGRNPAPLNVARKIDAFVEGVEHGYVLDLPEVDP